MKVAQSASAGTYALRVSRDEKQIQASLSGFFSLGQVAAYSESAEELIRRATATRGGYRMIIDLTDCAVQSQDVIAAFADHVARVPRAERLAVVADSAIVRRQIHRIIGRPEIAIFDRRPTAMEWLDAPLTADAI